LSSPISDHLDTEVGDVLLEDRNAVIYGAGGAVGRAIARTFAREGARVFLAGRTGSALDAVAEEIAAAGGDVETVQLDVLDRDQVDRHVDALVAKVGRLDVSLNAISIREVQGVPLLQMSVEDFSTPIAIGSTAHFVTATAAARHMVGQGSGVILTLSSSAARLSGRDLRYHHVGGFGTACAAIEALSRTLAGEVGPMGVRVVCLRPDAIPETWPEGFQEQVFEPGADPQRARARGMGGGRTGADIQAYMEDGTMLARMPTLADVADTAAFVASDRSSAMTGTVVDLTCGSIG
jgi:3-oxoacyl-[acyl-carrier protein] reductase